MAMAHAPLTHDHAAAAVKPDAHPVKRQFVPIRPAFRPLLPKPCTREPSPPNGIQIHTRTTLGTGRKRFSAGKNDAQKRRKLHSVPASASKSVRSGIPMESKDHVSDMKLLNRLSSVTGAGCTNGISTPISANDGGSISLRSISMAPSGSASQFSVSADSKLSKEMYSPEIVTSQLNSSISPIDDQVLPATPISIIDSPANSVSTASIFGNGSGDATPLGTIDPMNIVTDADNLDLQRSTLPALGKLETLDNGTLTPPSSNKTLPVNTYSPFGVGNEFDGFTDDFYFRSESASSAPEAIIADNNTSDTQESLAIPLESQSQAGSLELNDKEDEFSILEYLAPTADLF